VTPQQELTSREEGVGSNYLMFNDGSKPEILNGLFLATGLKYTANKQIAFGRFGK
jgi:hypothetical protein